MKSTIPSPLTDLLIELSDPMALERFQRAPKDYIRGRGLATHEAEAVITRNSALIRYFAKGGQYPLVGDPARKVVVGALAMDVIDTITTTAAVTTVAEADPNNPIRPAGTIYIGKNEQPYVIAA